MLASLFLGLLWPVCVCVLAKARFHSTSKITSNYIATNERTHTQRFCRRVLYDCMSMHYRYEYMQRTRSVFLTEKNECKITVWFEYSQVEFLLYNVFFFFVCFSFCSVFPFKGCCSRLIRNIKLGMALFSIDELITFENILHLILFEREITTIHERT